jgi:glyoxylase-like metal-dependent hydrolase (beta-lactamase superfamily II)
MTVAALDELRPGLWSLPMPMPADPPNPPSSCVYIFRDELNDLHVVDPGFETKRNWSLLAESLDHLGGLDRVRTIVATHLHLDHLGLSDRLRAASGAILVMHQAEQRAIAVRNAERWTQQDIDAQLAEWRVPENRRAELRNLLRGRRGPGKAPVVVADRLVVDEEALGIPGLDLVVMWTPGHTPGHICLRDEQRGVVLTGDAVLPTQNAGLGLGGRTSTNPLADHLTSLNRLSAYEALEVLPGHGARFHGLAERTAASREHHLRRTREAAGILAAEPDASIWRIAEQLTWTAGWTNVMGYYLFSALTQTEMHRGFVMSGGLG